MPPTATPPTSPARLATSALFALTTFAAATLVFLVQPMVVKQLLPVFGGAPNVWNSAVVFFQLVLLLGYAAAHLSLRRWSARRQLLLQLALSVAVLAFLPFAVRTGDAPPDGLGPALWVWALLALAVGVPYLAVTTASPVLQRWFADLEGDRGDDPYFLYVASNAGSLVGLLAFPLLLEPALSAGGQELAWAATYLAYLALLACCALLVWRRGGKGLASPAAAAPSGNVSARRRARWVLLAALPSSLMLGVTTYITTDVASAPLLWVVPLALYLVSFMVTFGHRFRIGPRVAGLGAAAAAIALAVVVLELAEVGEKVELAVHLAAMFAAAVLAHAALHADRPPASQLTLFYLLLSLGGVLGGAFTALLAPLAFDRVIEYPLLIAAVLIARPAPLAPRRHPRTWYALEALIAACVLAVFAVEHLRPRLLADIELGRYDWVALAAVLAVLALRRWGLSLVIAVLLLFATIGDPRDREDLLHEERNFFGVLRVEDTDLGTRQLMHGTTLHGSQFRGLERQGVPTTYYSTVGPVGDIFERLQEDRPFARIGVVGLGTGTIVAHAQRWQEFTFYEIDPAVIRVAKNPRYFTYLDRATVTTRIREGDARLQLAREPDGYYDLLVLDAYSSDAVPVHLLTVEAFRLFDRKVAPGGRMALHISSRHLDLEPVVAANAAALGLESQTRVDHGSTSEHFEADATGSQWVVLARRERDIVQLMVHPEWRPLSEPHRRNRWTDDHSDIASHLLWL